MRVTILGCGPSAGVPQIGGNWGACDPENPKNRRMRPSILVSHGDLNVLVDTSPDLRAQCLAADIRHLDAVLYTHDHADHLHGIDDLRVVRRLMGRNIEVYAEPDLLRRIGRRFGYLFSGGPEPGADELYRPILDAHPVDGPFRIGDLEVAPFEQDHGICVSWGFRFGRFAYSTDVVRLSEEAFEALSGVEVWVVDCLRAGSEHPTHANLDRVLEWIGRIGPRRAVLTHMNHQADYEAMRMLCPDGVEPAYDGMVLEIPG